MTATTRPWTTPAVTTALRAVVLFVSAAVPRLIELGAFVTPDERRWLERSVDLLRALQTGDLSLAYHAGNPAGIVTKWLGLLGVWVRYLLHQAGWRAHLDPTLAASRDLGAFMDTVSAQPQNVLDVLPAARVPVALVTALMVVAAYLLIRRLWGERAGLAAAIVLILDPFFLAHSRLLHQDALVSGFVLLSVLALAEATRGRFSWPLCAASGLLAGLAALTKPTALLLAPWAAAWLVWHCRRRAEHGRGRPARCLGALAAWGAALAVIYFAAWPAMWAAPWDTLIHAWERSAELASAGHNQLFFGQPTSDPGPLFYPVVWLFRSTPLSWLGLGLLGYLAARRATRDRSTAPRAGWLVLFALAFVFAITFSAKKNDRYALPGFLALDVLAGLGLAGWLELSGQWVRQARVRTGAVVGLAAIIGVGLLAWHHPYFLTYYNPLAGGPWIAPRVLLIGWGEGLDQAGLYLSRLPDAQSLSASSYYRREFSSFFPGAVRKLSDDTPEDFDLLAWHASDYIVSYVSQRQTLQPDPNTARFLDSLTPVHVVHLRGIDYAWVYRTPERVPDELIPAAHVLRRPFGQAILLFGHDDPILDADSSSLEVALYWQCLSPTPDDYQVRLQILDAAGSVRAENSSRPYDGQYPTNRWPVGVVIRDRHAVSLPDGLFPGEYRLSVDLVDASTQRLLAPQDGNVIIGPVQLDISIPKDGQSVETTTP